MICANSISSESADYFHVVFLSERGPDGAADGALPVHGGEVPGGTGGAGRDSALRRGGRRRRLPQRGQRHPQVHPVRRAGRLQQDR